MNFEIERSFLISVDRFYNQQNQLKKFREEFGSRFVFFNKYITDENFSKAAVVPMATEEWMVEIVLIKNEMTTNQCVDFLLKTRNARFMGPQAFSYVFEKKRELLPKGKIVAIHSEEYLLKEGGEYLIPYMNINNSYNIFNLRFLSLPIEEGERVIYFR